MSIEILLAFVGACLLLGLTPGPNKSLIVANTLTGGLSVGLVTLAGTTTGLAVLVAAAALGMGSIVVLMAEWFDLIRWIGALYLGCLGARQLWLLYRRGSQPTEAPAPVSRVGRYVQGLAVSLSNPKVMLFLGAFLPQYLDPSADPVRQLAVLALLFLAVLGMVDAGHVVAVAYARTTLGRRGLAVLDATAGVLLLLGGLALAMARPP